MLRDFPAKKWPEDNKFVTMGDSPYPQNYHGP